MIKSMIKSTQMVAADLESSRLSRINPDRDGSRALSNLKSPLKSPSSLPLKSRWLATLIWQLQVVRRSPDRRLVGLNRSLTGKSPLPFIGLSC